MTSLESYKDYVVYLVEYSGTMHPRFYVGSTSRQRLSNGYKGSVSSKKWKAIYETECRQNPHLYTITILSEHDSRLEALEAEKEFQICHNVVKDSEYVNMSIAVPNGFKGRDVSGANNPMYGVERSDEYRASISKANKGKIVASNDGGETWVKISTSEFHANRENYIVPKVEYSQKTTEATRNRVKNKTHHFCDPEVQAEIQRKRKANNWKHSDETKARMKISFKNRKYSWFSKTKNYEEFWILSTQLFQKFLRGVEVCDIRKEYSFLIVKKFQVRWFDRLWLKFAQGWNPELDNEFNSWRNEYESGKN